VIKPKLFEALMSDPRFKSEVPGVVEMAKSNPYFARYATMVIKEGLTRDVAGALGRMHDIVVRAAQPALISRECIWVLPTEEPLVRFPKARLGKARLAADLAEAWILGEKYETIDIKTDTVVKAGGEWSREFVEDATWPVMERQAAEIGRAVGELETEKVLSLYDGVAAGDLAGGAAIDKATDTRMDWDYVTALWDAVESENFHAKVLMMHPRQVSQLWRDDKFIHSFYFGEKADVARGVLGDVYLGMKIVSSTKCTNGVAYAVDTEVAAVELIRRDILTEPFENPRYNRYGVIASARVGLGVLRSKAVAKAINILTTM